VEQQHDEVHHTSGLEQPTWHPVERTKRARIARGLQIEPWRLPKSGPKLWKNQGSQTGSRNCGSLSQIAQHFENSLNPTTFSPVQTGTFSETINGKQWTELLRDYSSSVESSLCGLVLANRDVRLGG
jgi:hypothetical protein